MLETVSQKRLQKTVKKLLKYNLKALREGRFRVISGEVDTHEVTKAGARRTLTLHYYIYFDKPKKKGK